MAGALNRDAYEAIILILDGDLLTRCPHAALSGAQILPEPRSQHTLIATVL